MNICACLSIVLWAGCGVCVCNGGNKISFFALELEGRIDSSSSAGLQESRTNLTKTFMNWAKSFH